MAQTVTTIYVDDLDDTEITADQATTVAWSWRGVDYEFDTRAERLAGLEAGDEAITVAQLLTASRRVSGRRVAVRPVGARGAGSTDTAAIRSWARDNGIQVPDPGEDSRCSPQLLRRGAHRLTRSDVHSDQLSSPRPRAAAQTRVTGFSGPRRL